MKKLNGTSPCHFALRLVRNQDFTDGDIFLPFLIDIESNRTDERIGHAIRLTLRPEF